MTVSNSITPYSDRYMIWDEASCRYYLTNEALEENGVHLKTRLSANRTADAIGVINGLLRRVTSMIYNYIHKHSANNSAQDEFIKHNAFARSIIYRALLFQAKPWSITDMTCRVLELAEPLFLSDLRPRILFNGVVYEALR